MTKVLFGSKSIKEPDKFEVTIIKGKVEIYIPIEELDYLINGLIVIQNKYKNGLYE